MLLDGQDSDKIFLEMEGIQRKLKDLDQTISEEMLLGITLSKLPSSYETLITILEAG